MTGTDSFRREQRHVLAAMLAGLAVTAITIGAAMVLDRADMPPPFADRLRHALRAELAITACLAAAIANVARLRFFSQRDVAGGNGGDASPPIRRGAAILQNTLEQAILAVTTHLVLVATLERSDLLVTALACLFVAGRLLFAIGYARGAAGRAFGFALTFYPSVAALLLSAVIAVSGP